MTKREQENLNQIIEKATKTEYISKKGILILNSILKADVSYQCKLTLINCTIKKHRAGGEHRDLWLAGEII